MPQYIEKDPEKLRENQVQQLVEFAQKVISSRGPPRSPSSIHTLKQIVIHESKIRFYHLSRFDAEDLGERAAEIALKGIGIL